MNNQEAEGKIRELENQLKEKEEYIRYLENLSEAHNNIIMLANEERIEAEKTLHAHENIHGIGKLITEATSEEALKSISSGILEFKQPAASVLENGILLDNIVQAFASLFSIERSILFIREKDKLSSHLYSNITPEEIKKPAFNFSTQVIREVFQNKKPVVIQDKIIEESDEKLVLSIVCVPLIYKNILVGIIYGDKTL